MKQIKDITELKKGDYYIKYFLSKERWIVYKLRNYDGGCIYGIRMFKANILSDAVFPIGQIGPIINNNISIYRFDDSEEAKDYVFIEEL